MKIAICAIAKNEKYYINDWVSYHINLGIDHIYLYDNEDENSPVHYEDYIDAKFFDKVTIINVRGLKQYQMQAYNACFKMYRSDYDWMAFIDCDEFITIVDKSKSIKDVISGHLGYNEFDGITLDWVIFNDGDMIEGDLSKPVWERFKNIEQRREGNREYWNVKTIVNTNRDIDHIRTHTPSNGKMCNLCTPNGKERVPYEGGEWWANKTPNTDIMYLSHFPTKTVSEFIVQKFHRGNAETKNLKRYDSKSYMWKWNKKTVLKQLYLDKLDAKTLSERLEKTWTNKPTNTIGQLIKERFKDAVITSIGDRCFAQHLIYCFTKNDGVKQSISLVSRLTEYPQIIYQKNQTYERWGVSLDKLPRYDEFCKSFISDIIVGNSVRQWWAISKNEKCQTHYSKTMNYEQQAKNLHNADVIWFVQRFETYKINDNLTLTNPTEIAHFLNEQLSKLINHPFKVFYFTKWIDKDTTIGSCDIRRIEQPGIGTWNNDVLSEVMQHTKMVKCKKSGWMIPENDIPIYDKAWDDTKRYVINTENKEV